MHPINLLAQQGKGSCMPYSSMSVTLAACQRVSLLTPMSSSAATIASGLCAADQMGCFSVGCIPVICVSCMYIMRAQLTEGQHCMHSQCHLYSIWHCTMWCTMCTMWCGAVPCGVPCGVALYHLVYHVYHVVWHCTMWCGTVPCVVACLHLLTTP